jgi:hypothetical protein
MLKKASLDFAGAHHVAPNFSVSFGSSITHEQWTTAAHDT